MSAGGIEVGVGLGAFLLKYAWQATTFMLTVIAVMAGWMVKHYKVMVDGNKKQLEDLTQQVRALESVVTENNAQISELNQSRDKTIILETKAESTEKLITVMSQDIKTLLSKAEYRK